MHFVKKSFAAAALIAASMMGASYSQAQTVVFNSAGSSAQWQTFALAAAQLATKGAPYTVHRYTAKGTATDGNPYAGIADTRKTSGTQTPPNTTPPVESGNIWIVWNENGNGTPVSIYAFTSVDSVIGLRSFFAVPRAKVALDVAVESTKGQQLISATLPYWGTEDSSVPAAVYNVLNDLPLTAANTDIRPEDGLFAFNRIIATLNTTNYNGLGYGPGLIGTGIKSHYSATVATPVAFSLTGADPITGDAHPSGGYITVPVGASPIVFAVNQTGLTFSSHDLSVTESTGNTAENIFSGTKCVFKGLAVNPILREPLSGTYNTTEFTNFRLSANEDLSQEVGVNPKNANNNPLDLACASGGGTRTRAIGTGESIKAVLNNGGLGGTGAGNINYAFFGYGNYSSLAANANYSYLTLDTVDPINANFSNGEFPSCPAAGCPIAGGASFPNLRNGKYRSWSLLRVVTDTESANPTNYTNTVALVNAADKLINKSVPDFVPFLASCSTSGANEPGLDVYRSHFTQSGVTGVNGSVPVTVDCAAHTGEPAQDLSGLTLGGGTEAGGDVGGKIEGPFTTSPTEPGVLNAKQ